MKYVFIINPNSGNRKGLLAGKAIDEYCKNLNLDYKLIYTNEKGDAEILSKKYSCFKGTKIYSVGGDGTLNEIVNGMVHSNSILSVIPTGSGNDFYKSIDENYNDFVDIGKVNDRFFINIASIGIDADIARDANKLKTIKVPSEMIYIASLVKNYFIFNGVKLYINDVKKNLTIFTVCNGKYYGGGFKIAPNANLSDGLFDIYEIGKLNKIKTLILLSKLVKGILDTDSNVKHFQTKKIYVDSDFDLTCNIDGEIIKAQHFEFSIKKKALKLDNLDELKIRQLLKTKKIIK